MARVVDSTWTKTGLMLGTPSYMSPEQAFGQREIDARSDLFGLGCVAYECVSGRRAFEGKQVFAVLRSILLEEPTPIAELVPQIPSQLAALIKRMMSKNIAERPQSAAEVETALAALDEEALDDASAPAPLRTLTEREQRIITVLSIAEDEASIAMDETAVADLLQPTASGLDPTGTLQGLLDRTGSKVSRCSASSFVMVFPPSGIPIDRAAQAAECALSLRGVWRGRAMVLASSRTEVGPWVETRAAESAERLLADREGPAGDPQATQIMLDDVTARLLDERFQVAESPRGLALVGDGREDDEGRARASMPALAGRERELDAIRATFEECVDEPVARVALVTGPAGMGKSRLRRALVDILTKAAADGSEDGGKLQIWSARGEPLRAGLPFGLVMQLAEQARGTFGEGAALSTQTQDAWAEFLARECETGPVLIVIEDLQWGDAMSVRALDIALRDLQDAPLMVVAFARPEVHQLFPKLWSERAIEEIRLPPLTKAASERLVREILGAGAAADVMARIVEQAEGIPLYLVALAQGAASGAPSIPDAVLAMVQSRFDGLDANARRTLRAASIFGRTFWRGGVEALTGSDVQVDDGLADLEEAKLIASQAEGRFAGDREYQFRTTLLREAAYAMLIEGDRALGHVLAAIWLEHVGEQDTHVIDTHRELGRVSAG